MMKATEYAVFGAGWGGEYLSTIGDLVGSSIEDHHWLERRHPGMQNVSDTYCIYDNGGDYGWHASELECEG